jgi:hypothetical protein
MDSYIDFLDSTRTHLSFENDGEDIRVSIDGIPAYLNAEQLAKLKEWISNQEI